MKQRELNLKKNIDLKMLKLNDRQKERLVMWLINERQHSVDTAIEQVENFPHEIYVQYLTANTKVEL